MALACRLTAGRGAERAIIGTLVSERGAQSGSRRACGGGAHDSGFRDRPLVFIVLTTGIRFLMYPAIYRHR
jgi:hypothetical protein